MTITRSQGLIRTPGLHGLLSRFTGFALVAAVVGVETLAVVLLQHRGHGHAVEALYLIGVLVVSAMCELGLAVATSLGSAIALLYTYAGQYELDAVVVAGLFLVVAVPTNFVADFARRVVRHGGERRWEAEPKATISNSGPTELSLLAQQHYALRRTATMVARGASPEKVFSMVSDELARCLNVDTAAMFRFEPDGTVVLLGGYTNEKKTTAGVGRGLSLEGDRIAATVLRDGRRAPMETHENVAGAVAARLRNLGLHSPIVAPIIVDNRAWGLLVVGSSAGEALPQQAESWVKDLADLVATAIANAAASDELEASRERIAALASQQEALRRVATLVARGAGPEECFAAVAEETARCLNVDKAEVFRYEDDGSAIAVACHASSGTAHIPIGERVTTEDAVIATELFRTGRASRMDGNEHAPDSVDSRLRDLGLGSVAGAPIVVDGRVWGMVVVGSTRAKSLPANTNQRIAEFADLVATSIAACTTRAELIASRARIVAASDEARRRLERDLHDGAQQRLVTTRLKLRAAAEDVPDGLDALKNGLAEVASDLTDATNELQEISRGIHPAILSKGGLAPALRTLADRSAIPATVEIEIEGPMPDLVEVGAYYIVAEALTNAAKHSHATEVIVSAHDEDANLHLSVTDNGIGGANAGKGSGLVGLNDRVEALGGKMTITSIPGRGTSLNVTIPVSTMQAAWSSSSETKSLLLTR